MADKDIKEFSRNFTPPIPTELHPKPLGGVRSEIARAFEMHSLSPQEVQDNTSRLFDLLTKRVELKIDIFRLSKEDLTNEQKVPSNLTKTLGEKLVLIKKGAVHEVLGGVPTDSVPKRTLEGDLKELRETDQQISNLTKFPEVAKQYNLFREKRVDQLRQSKEVSECEKLTAQLRLQQEKMARTVYLAGRQYSPGERQIIDDNRQMTRALEERAEALKRDSEVFDLVRLRELQGYQQGLKTDRFAETPSRGKYIDIVRQYWAQGKKVLLTGPTGGGKTELLMHASRSLFNEEAERVTGHELMTNYELYGKMKGGVSREGQMTLMFGSAGTRELWKKTFLLFLTRSTLSLIRF